LSLLSARRTPSADGSTTPATTNNKKASVLCRHCCGDGGRDDDALARGASSALPRYSPVQLAACSGPASAQPPRAQLAFPLLSEARWQPVFSLAIPILVSFCQSRRPRKITRTPGLVPTTLVLANASGIHSKRIYEAFPEALVPAVGAADLSESRPEAIQAISRVPERQSVGFH
jgi:hypothetical protein